MDCAANSTYEQFILPVVAAEVWEYIEMWYYSFRSGANPLCSSE